MQLHLVKREHKRMKSRQIGRGGKRGKTSGRGGKGQTARAGAKVRPEMRDVIMKLPKLRGFSFKSFQKKPAIVSLRTLEKNFSDGEKVNVQSLISKKLVEKSEGTAPAVKILGDATAVKMTKKLFVEGCLASKSAKEAIEKAGGKISG